MQNEVGCTGFDSDSDTESMEENFLDSDGEMGSCDEQVAADDVSANNEGSLSESIFEAVI